MTAVRNVAVEHAELDLDLLRIEHACGQEHALADEIGDEADLRALMATTGDEIGRFNDTDLQGFGNYANGLGQALAVLALAVLSVLYRRDYRSSALYILRDRP